MLNTKVFEKRTKSLNYYKKLDFWYSKINQNNILKFSKKKITKFYNLKDFNDFVTFRFNLINEYIKLNLKYEWKFITNLKKIIVKLDIEDFLEEKHIKFVNELESIIFTRSRILKALDSDLNLDKKHKCYFIYENLIYKTNEKSTKLKNVKRIYILNDEIILKNNQNDIMRYKFSEIENIQLESKFVLINLKNSNNLYLWYEELETLYYSLNRLINIE